MESPTFKVAIILNGKIDIHCRAAGKKVEDPDGIKILSDPAPSSLIDEFKYHMKAGTLYWSIGSGEFAQIPKKALEKAIAEGRIIYYDTLL